jgi:hypothetical protein
MNINVDMKKLQQVKPRENKLNVNLEKKKLEKQRKRMIKITKKSNSIYLCYLR